MNKSHIYNLKELDEALKAKSENTSYTEVLNAIRFSFKEVEHLCFWDAESYSKINIGNGANYELVLICWENGQQSQIHQHDEHEAFTYVLKGEITEEIFKNPLKSLTPEKIKVLTKRDITSIINKGKKEHCLINSYKGRSVTLHLYVDEV